MPVKAVPVEVEEEPPKEAEVQDAEPAKEESKAEEVEKKRKPRRSKEEMIEEKARKEKAKAAKDAEKIEMKARVQCPICKAKMSQWNLLYKHTCSKEKLEKKPKAPTLEEKFPELDEDEGKKRKKKATNPQVLFNCLKRKFAGKKWWKLSRVKATRNRPLPLRWKDIRRA